MKKSLKTLKFKKEVVLEDSASNSRLELETNKLSIL